MKKIFAFLWAVAVGFFCLAGLYGGDVEFPLVQSMAYFPFSENDHLNKNEYSFSLNLAYSNIYVTDGNGETVSDMESAAGTLGFRYGLSKSLTFELYYRLLAAYGGVLDNVIVNFHDLFGLREGGRDQYPPHSFLYKHKDYFEYRQAVLAQSPVVVSVLWNPWRSEHFSLGVRAGLGIPLSSRPGFGTDKIFLSAGVILVYEKDNFTVGFSNHLSFFKTPDWLGNEDVANRIFLSEIRVGFKKFFAGLLFRTSPFREGERSDRALQVYLGFKIGKRLELSIAEEFPPIHTSPDVTFNLRWVFLKKK